MHYVLYDRKAVHTVHSRITCEGPHTLRSGHASRRGHVAELDVHRRRNAHVRLSWALAIGVWHPVAAERRQLAIFGAKLGGWCGELRQGYWKHASAVGMNQLDSLDPSNSFVARPSTAIGAVGVRLQ